MAYFKHRIWKHFLGLIVVLTYVAAQPQKGYVEYGDYDARQCLKVAKAEDGKESLDLKCVDGIMDDLAKRAKGCAGREHRYCWLIRHHPVKLVAVLGQETVIVASSLVVSLATTLLVGRVRGWH